MAPASNSATIHLWKSLAYPYSGASQASPAGSESKIEIRAMIHLFSRMIRIASSQTPGGSGGMAANALSPGILLTLCRLISGV